MLIFSGFGSIQTAIESMKMGAFDYITEPISNDELLMAEMPLLSKVAMIGEVRSPGDFLFILNTVRIALC